ncbi:hypothetical protein Gotur_034988, partial [Gossypium turneri]
MRISSPNFKNISKYTAARDVLMYYAKERNHVKEELAKALDWKLQKRIIRFRALFPPYDGLNIADELVLCLSQWGIDKKIFSITLDNASYNDVMVSCLKNYFRANRAILCDGTFFYVRCCAHILNLIVKDGLELSNDVVDFVETILINLRLLFDEYVKKSKSTSSSLAGSSNVLDKNPIDSNLNEHNVNSADFGGDFDESDDYKRQIDVLHYWRKSSVRYNELSLLARDLLAIPISTVASKLTFSMGKKVITHLRSSLKPKKVQAFVCLDDW